MYYLQSRYYNPEWGRFINADGIIGQTGELLGHNLFAYCKNNPVNMSDPNGKRGTDMTGELERTITFIFGVLVGITVITYPLTANPQNISKPVSKSKIESRSVPIANTKKQKYEYYEASTKKGGGINIESPLTLTEAQARVLRRKDVYAASQLHAVLLAGTLGGTENGPDDPDIHPWSPDNKYHYHLKGHVGGHIFFDK